jgi:nicotinate-nucleotide pyrophosphorylase (carboxylating)
MNARRGGKQPRREVFVRPDFSQIEWNSDVEEDCLQLVRLAVREDLGREFDWTTVALVDGQTMAEAAVVARKAGVIAGLRAAQIVLEEMDQRACWLPQVDDGARVAQGTVVATVTGPARTLLTAERLILNFVGHLSGIATLARKYVDAVAGTKAHIYDTRKTTPGWRRLEKYAVRLGGASNHRTGLFDAILIKDNHLALGAAASGQVHFSPSEAVLKARRFLEQLRPEDTRPGMIVEVEVDTLAQLELVLPVGPDIVLLDNMSTADLMVAVRRRDEVAPDVQLEASGGVNLSTVAAIAHTGVERISVGALTHSAEWFDVGLDWC